MLHYVRKDWPPHQPKTDLKVTEDILESYGVRDAKSITAQLHCAHKGQNKVKNSTADQLRLHLQQEGQELTTKKQVKLGFHASQFMMNCIWQHYLIAIGPFHLLLHHRVCLQNREKNFDSSIQGIIVWGHRNQAQNGCRSTNILEATSSTAWLESSYSWKSRWCKISPTEVTLQMRQSVLVFGEGAWKQ